MGNSSRRYDLVVIVIVFAVALVLQYTEAFSLLENETLSYRQILRTHYGSPQFTSPSQDVVIVYTDEAFYKDYGAYPLRREDIGKLIRRLAKMGAKVIGVDMLLDFNSAYGEDPSLEAALKEAGNVVLVSRARIDDNKFVGVDHAIPRFFKQTRSGYSNISSNSAISESFVSLPIYADIGRAGEWPFSVEVVTDYLDQKAHLQDHVLHIGKDIAVRLNHFNEMFIDYPLLPPSDNGRTLTLHETTGVHATDILFSDEDELDDLSYLVQGKIVLMGEVAAVAHDEFETPVGNVFGVEVIANEISTMLRNGPLYPASLGVEIVTALLLMVGFLAASLIANPLPRNVASILLVGLYIALVSWLYVSQGMVFSMSYMLLAMLFAMIASNVRYYLQERGQKAQIRSAFGQYLSPKVVADLVRDPERLSLGGEERELTAFFSDIQGFSTISEEMSPSELVHALNEYLTAMCNIIIAAEGTVDKFEGDAIIAFWGAPSFQGDHARRACFAAIDMQHAVKEIRERWLKEGLPRIHVRMGLNTGPMVVGNMGSAQRFNYTIMGDAVNLASRLEGANKAYGSRILISDATYQQCKDDVDVRELDTVRVVGKSEPVVIYELLNRKGRTRGLEADLMLQFERARQHYLDRDWAAARAAFKLCASIDPDDGPSRTFLARCDAFLKKAPSARWDGIHVLEEK